MPATAALNSFSGFSGCSLKSALTGKALVEQTPSQVLDSLLHDSSYEVGAKARCARWYRNCRGGGRKRAPGCNPAFQAGKITTSRRLLMVPLC
jgi:hypothetical protein